MINWSGGLHHAKKAEASGEGGGWGGGEKGEGGGVGGGRRRVAGAGVPPHPPPSPPTIRLAAQPTPQASATSTTLCWPSWSCSSTTSGERGVECGWVGAWIGVCVEVRVEGWALAALLARTRQRLDPPPHPPPPKMMHSVLYVDIDVHHGDGVEEAFLTTDRVMTVRCGGGRGGAGGGGTRGGGLPHHRPRDDSEVRALCTLFLPLCKGLPCTTLAPRSHPPIHTPMHAHTPPCAHAASTSLAAASSRGRAT